LALALFATLTLMAGGWLVPPAKDKSLRVVHLITEPGGAKAALIPISEEDGRPRVDKAIMPSGLTPVRVADVPPGDYLVVVEVKGHGFHEVFRRVPRFGEPKPTFQETAFPHTAFEVREDQSVELPEVHVPNVGEFAEMPFLPKLTFEMGNAAFGPSVATPYRVTLDAYHLDATEVTVGEFRRVMKGLPAQLRALSPQDDEPVRFVNFDDAVQFAELAGKRLPSEEEYERAATNGGKNRFPWGDDLAAIKSWVIAPVGQPEYDRAVERPLIKGLYSNVAEWTSSRSVPYPGDSSWPGDLIAKLRDTRVVRGGPASAIYGRPLEEESRRQKWDARYRMGVLAMERNIGLGFRCARSAAPRFPGSAAE
jgi:formylglycine-generating enzyme required for sulfatase activity